MKSKYKFEFMELDDQIIAVPVGDEASLFNGVIKLNDFSAFILKLLQDNTDETEILKKLEEEFDADTDVLKNALHNSLLKFRQAGVL